MLIYIRKILLRPGEGSDHAHIITLPPLLFIFPLGLSMLINLIFPFSLLMNAALGATIGLVIMFLGLVVMGWAVTIFKKYDEELDPRLPTNIVIIGGPYHFTRNPMYISFTILYIGAAFIFNSWWALLLLPIALFFTHYGVVIPEEIYLEKKFGESYLSYKSDVSRWLFF